MRNLGNILFALAALLWLPVSAHCQLESATGLEFFHCADKTSDSQNPARDCRDCCALEKSQYRSQQIRLTIPAPDLSPLSATPSLPAASTLPVAVRPGSLTAAPPQLLQTRQFLFRTALPARAPSLAS